MDRRDVSKRIAILIAGSIFILVLFVYIPTVSANVQDETTAHTQLVTATSVQRTPTVDPTLTTLQKEQLNQQIVQQQHTLGNWFWNLITASLSTLALVIGGLFAFFRWLRDREDVRRKEAEERFKSVVDGLGGETTETQIASAVLLRTFLRPEYEEYYTQVFDLGVASLRIPENTNSSTTKASDQSKQILTETNKPTEETQEPSKAKSSKALHSLRQALISLFKEALPRARDRLKKQNRMRLRSITILEGLLPPRGILRTFRIRLLEMKRPLRFTTQSLDASDIQLDNAFLVGADLRQAYMPGASLQNANLRAARLNKANLRGANLTAANLEEAILTSATLEKAIFKDTILTSATLDDANLGGAPLKDAKFLNGTNLRGVHGLTREQLEAYHAKGAIIDEDYTASLPQASVSPPPSSQSNNAQAPSAPPAQERTPTPETDSSS